MSHQSREGGRKESPWEAHCPPPQILVWPLSQAEQRQEPPTPGPIPFPALLLISLMIGRELRMLQRVRAGESTCHMPYGAAWRTEL